MATLNEAVKHATWMRRMFGIVMYVVSDPGKVEFDSVAAKDWDEPHERNRRTPERKARGWTVHLTVEG